jgi:hypothetical protein
MEHAWCVNRKTGKVVDPTWDNTEENVYFGIPFNRKWLLKHVLKKQTYGILSGYKNWDMPHLTGKLKPKFDYGIKNILTPPFK